MVYLLLGCMLAACGTSTRISDATIDILKTDLQSLVDDFDGVAGIYVHHFPAGKEIAINADTLFPTASMIKVPILATLFSRIEAGELDYGERLVYDEDRLYAGEDILGSFKGGEKISLSRLVALMITFSDNTASLWCQELAGTGTAINAWLSSNGYTHTRMNSRTPDRGKNWEKYGWGQTTPREIAGLITQIYNGEAVSPAASEEMYRVLSKIYWDNEALAQLPPTVQAASKQGAVSQSRSEVVLVNAPSGDYVFAVITKDQTDAGWSHDNAGYRLIRSVSRLLWETFEPASEWRSAITGKYRH